MILKVLFSFFGVLAFLFFFWRRLKDDYDSRLVFSTAFYSLFLLFLGLFLGLKYLPAFWFWACLLGAFLGLAAGILRFRLSLIETVEAGLISLLPWYSLVFFLDSFQEKSLSSLIGFSMTLFLFALFFILENKYRGFVWYKSGRVGFSGFVVLGTLFLTRSLVALFFRDVLSLAVTNLDVFISATVAFAFYLIIFHLARKE